MGGRVEGKVKKKSVKAKVTSKFGSKRRLSRMGKKQQKGKSGVNAEFITRSAAIRKLQITLKDFRRLCILKGIYPRVPSKAPSGGDKIYYDIKDISYIMHEPLLNKFREFKAFMKKIRRAAGRNQFNDARKKNDLKPKMTLDHLVKERYPRFIDALRDLDDALCMVSLWIANVMSSVDGHI
jgi:pescadillo protein